MRPIDADILVEEFEWLLSVEHYSQRERTEDALNRVKNAKTLTDLEPVKHGYWICGKTILNRRTCSCCKSYFDMLEADNYCPSCGAKMDLEEQ